MIVVRHRKGPLAGREDRPEGDKDRIVFGRDPSVCQVVYPPDATIVGRRHFALVRELSGEWTVDLFGDPYVAVNGEPAEHGATVHSGDTFALGRHDGPSFEVEVAEDGIADSLPFTQTQERVESNYRKSRRASRVATAAIVFAALAGGSAATVGWLMRDETARLASLTRKVDEAAAGTISKEVRDRLISAAYFVYAEGVGYGSASPVAPDTMATNAHVAEMFDELKPGKRMWVIGPGSGGKRFQVISVHKHPGYDAFQKFFGQDLLMVEGRAISGGRVPTYDVALMRLAPGSQAGPVLELATPEEIASLRPGTPLAMAGYPAEGIVGVEVRTEAATPTYSAGVVTALTDMFMLPADTAHQLLVNHNLPSAGGASGSPMVTASGRVIAYHNAGNSFSQGEGKPRIPSAALINYAQRSDMLGDLEAGRADATVEADRPYWAKQAARFKQGIEYFVPRLVAEAKDDKDNGILASSTPTLVSQVKGELKSADIYEIDGRVKDEESGKMVPGKVKKRQKIFPVKVEPGRPHTFVVYAQGRSPIELYVVVDSAIARQSASRAWFARTTYTAPGETTAQIYVAGPDDDIQFTLFDYSWGGPPS